MSRSESHLIQIIVFTPCSHTLLRCSNTWMWPGVLSSENILELNHAWTMVSPYSMPSSQLRVPELVNSKVGSFGTKLELGKRLWPCFSKNDRNSSLICADVNTENVLFHGIPLC